VVAPPAAPIGAFAACPVDQLRGLGLPLSFHRFPIARARTKTSPLHWPAALFASALHVSPVFVGAATGYGPGGFPTPAMLSAGHSAMRGRNWRRRTALSPRGQTANRGSYFQTPYYFAVSFAAIKTTPPTCPACSSPASARRSPAHR
jgi:hypothetical protein